MERGRRRGFGRREGHAATPWLGSTVWLLLLLVPYVAVALLDPGALAGVVHYKGEQATVAGFDLHLFGAALTVGIATGH